MLRLSQENIAVGPDNATLPEIQLQPYKLPDCPQGVRTPSDAKRPGEGTGGTKSVNIVTKAN
jgi:hypothetical protein